MNSSPDNHIKEPIGRIMANIGNLYLSALHRSLSHLDIKRSFYPLLIIESGNGKITQQELATKLSCDKVQVVRIIDYLSSIGYVTRARDENDRRKYNLEITEKARESMPSIIQSIGETTAKALKNLPEGKIDELYSLLRNIENNLTKTDKQTE